MSNATRGQAQSCVPHTHRPITGLFFLFTFLLLTIIPASAYLEIGAKSFLQREHAERSAIYRCGMTATQYVPAQTLAKPAPVRVISGPDAPERKKPAAPRTATQEMRP
jgi:hypothetical protein